MLANYKSFIRATTPTLLATTTMTQGDSFEIFFIIFVPAARVGSARPKSQLATCNAGNLQLATCSAANLQPPLATLLQTDAKLQLHQVQICKSSGLQPQLSTLCGGMTTHSSQTLLRWQLWLRCQLVFFFTVRTVAWKLVFHFQLADIGSH